MRLNDALKGSEGPPSELWDLVEHLPPGSAIQRAVDPDWMWDHDAHFKATIVDELRFMRFENRRMHGASKERRGPDPIPRPGVTPPEDQNVYGRGSAMPMEDMAEWLGGGFANLN